MTHSLAIIIPVFNEADAIAPFRDAMVPVLQQARTRFGLEIRLVFVDDGSSDGTAQVIAETDWPVAVQLLSLSRNFGKEAAMTAGLAHAPDDAVVVMDVDLQDPPELIIEMVRLWTEGAKVVLARRNDRSSDGFRKRVTAQWFYRLHNRISNIDIPYYVGDFRLMDRAVVAAVNQLPENRRFMKGLFAWVGFAPVFLDYKRPVRQAGKTKFSGWKLWRFAVEGITGFSEVPLVIWTYMGALIALVSFLYAGFIVLRTLVFGVDVPGYASLITIMLFLGGIQVLGIGVLGEYLGRVYSEVKRRPPYIIAETQELPARKSDAG
jgi:glycosyltransferase involved in cell wall biosynthesis